MSASVGSRRAGSKAWGGWAAVAVIAVLAVGCGKTAERTPPNVDVVPWSAGEQFNPDIAYDSLVYEGQTYRTVKIGELTWMAENLNFKTERSRCYGEGDSVRIGVDEYTILSNTEIQANCVKYGRLYDWDDAMTACPAGWRVPSDAEWDDLAKAVGGVRNEYGSWEIAGIKLKSKIDWDENGNGTDDFGFSALPGGCRWDNGRFLNVGSNAYLWSATEYDANGAWFWSMYYYSGSVNRYDFLNKRHSFSVRCVQEK